MKLLKRLLPIALLLAAGSTYAQSFPEDKVRQIEQKSIEIAQKYAERTGKPVPEIQDYRYSMKLNVAKVIYQSPKIEYCGVIPQIMVFEDTSEELRSIRYRGLGECRNQR
ncbi:DUF2790 domain-containing protein [Ectopseudomonas oleovorans]|uniref:DUF2790 domain-containing protein n=1 Tax=Ectopseudomonas oleovorans TaxID=301 RepID=A0AA42QAR0_ECTOL|nr:DUF2790 domain-containing protein [Pseudomonas oleovorans]MDH1339164.1 DUF2790 domain-containing protein [Pseudomonas oleovorans]MDH1494464.1 DUF2790 domain-containing protein [Pseudomonas oleovorans]MDH2201615.1 DUF2790 domain-containing protein [Pseudomonas oleovorans]WGG21058.1 DUF2790 domain-containing protein [Pseudomonas oleovorans]